MRRIRFSSFSLSLAALSLLASLAAHDARADWPPDPNMTAKDMANPDNWPNDPGYAFSASDNGAWNYYSFMPDVAKNVRPEEIPMGSGMSIDLAWRWTQGDDSVRILVTDSGIEWDQRDLLDSAYLSAAELASHKPTNADGTACGGTGALAGFDCNGDGVLSVSDYKDTPVLQPEASDGHPKGDKNGNGHLDAGDLILNFSDGVDDDANGYIDDISGWDFMKNDNDPYDDTRYGHGTGEAEDSTAAANNGIDGAGVCPKCRFIPARVGDSFITDVGWFAKAVVYAADNGASVVQCALGTINMNNFAQSALDYAYKKNVLVITSMADENARHHNMPAASNHTLPVHAIQYDASSWAKSTTFLAYHPCSNFGGQNFLSASGTGCSSEATGRLSGIAGLVYSAAKQNNVVLRPGEAQSIFFTTADDIDVPESREEDPIYQWSQPGFDQRFGYGRVNANRAVEAVKDKKIPPSVDITEPRWFSVLYKDQVEGPIDIVGTISAPMATSYDYVAEWAPGVQPLEGEFKVFKEEKNIPPDTVAGSAGGPLAALEIRDMNIDNPPDRDSKYGENRYTITVRVRATAHYGGTKGDVAGEMRRTYYVYSDPTLVKGFPMFLGDSGESSAKMADIDGDGVRDIVYPTAGGEVHVLRMTPDGPVKVTGFPFRTNRDDGLAMPPPTPTTPVYLSAPAYASGDVNPDLGREPITNAPAIADMDGDGKPEIIVTTWAGTLYVIGSDGALKPGWPVRLPEVPSCSLDAANPTPQPCMDQRYRIARGAFASPVVIDMNKDGKLDVVQAAFDGNVYVFDASGEALEGWPVNIHYTGELSDEPDRNRILTTPAAADFTGDGIPDLVVGSNEKLGNGGQAGAVYLVDGRGTKAPSPVLPRWPISMTSFEIFPLVAEGVPNSPVAADFDGTLAAIAHGNATSPLILPLDPGTQQTLTAPPTNALPVRPDPNDPSKTSRGVDPSSVFGELSKASTPNTMLPLFAQPSAGDIDQDGVPDVVASGGSLTLAAALQASSGTSQGDQLLSVWSGKTGKMLPGAPFLLEDFTFFNSQAIADITGDDYPEVLSGSGGYFLHAFDGCGREPTGWPKFTGQWIISTPALGDIDGDGTLEVVIGTRNGWLYAWHTEGKTDSIIEWESYHHDNQNTGYLGTPLTQGAKKKAAEPLTTELCAPVPDEDDDPNPYATGGGGCECKASPGTRSGAPYAAMGFAAALGLLGLRRRRK